jgi:hypothetical protein
MNRPVNFLVYLLLTNSLFFDFSYTDEIRNVIKSEIYTQPEQVHLSYGSIPTQMIVTWVTLDPINDSVVEYGIDKINKVANGTTFVFKDGGAEHRKIAIHRVVLDSLIPGQEYSRLFNVYFLLNNNNHLIFKHYLKDIIAEVLPVAGRLYFSLQQCPPDLIGHQDLLYLAI